MAAAIPTTPLPRRGLLAAGAAVAVAPAAPVAAGALPATFDALCAELERAMDLYSAAALRLEEAERLRDHDGLRHPCFEALFEAETAAGARRADLFAAVMAWPVKTPAEAARKLRLAAGELPVPEEEFGARLAYVAMIEAAEMLARVATGGAA